MSVYDPDQFAAHVDRLRPALVCYACETMPCQQADGEDIVAEAIRIALLVLERYNAASCTLMTWMRAIVRNVVLRAREKAEEALETVPLEEAASLPAPPARSPRAALQPHIDALSEKLRPIISDRLDGYTLEEIARRNFLTRKTVARRIVTAIVELQLGFPDRRRPWMTFVDECGEHASYTPQNDMSKYWKGNHPRRRPRREAAV